MIRVLHIIGPMNPGGAEGGLLQILRRLKGTGVGFSFTAFPDRPGAMDEEVRALGGTLVPLPLWRNPFPHVHALKREFRSGQYDVVHAHHPELAGYMLKYAQDAGIKARFVHARATHLGAAEAGIRGLLYRTVGRRRTLSATTRGIAVSALAARYVFGTKWQQDRRFSVIHNAVDLDAFAQKQDRRAIRAELCIPHDSLVIGHIGRFTWEKNHARLLQIAALIMKRHPQARALLVGDGPTFYQAQSMSRDLGIDEGVIFAGERRDIHRMLATMDVFLFPSLREGLPLACIEAQAAGVPVVLASSVTPEVAVVEDRVAIVDLDAPDKEWAAACERMAARRKLDDRSGLETIRCSDFNADIATANLVEEYCRAVAGTRAGP